MSSPPGFTCTRCGKRHPCPKVERKQAPPEERAKLRAEMLKAEELLEQNWGVESYERKHARAEMAYYSSLGYVDASADGWGFPETATTSQASGGGWYVHCKDCNATEG